MKALMENILMDEILLITEHMRAYFPSCYAVLDETPLFLENEGNGRLDHDLHQYLNSISAQWYHLITRTAS